MEKKYVKNYLKSVIFRMDFLTSEKDIYEIMKKEIIDKIQERFKYLEPIQTINNTNIFYDETTNNLQANKEELKRYVFHTVDGSADLIIDPVSIVINYNKYINSEDLKKNIEVLNSIIPQITVNRVGLRYVNYFENNKLGSIDWEKYISEDLLKTIKYDYETKVLQAINVVDLKYEECVLKIQYGLHNQNFPSDRIKDAFVLDFDASSNEITSRDNVSDIAIKWNGIIENLFEKAIKDDLRSVLNSESDTEL